MSPLLALALALILLTALIPIAGMVGFAIGRLRGEDDTRRMLR